MVLIRLLILYSLLQGAGKSVVAIQLLCDLIQKGRSANYVTKNFFVQVGCIHTSQGLEFDYCGVIIGKDLFYQDRVKTDFTQRAKGDKSIKGIKTTKNYDLADKIIRNTYKTLLSRGQKGCYVYCEDKALLEYMSKMLNKEIIK